VPGTAQSGDTGTWTPSGPFNDVRAGAAAVRLLDGRVLLAGGVPPTTYYSAPATASAEIFDPNTGQWTPTSSMAVARADAAAALLPDGRVLVAGGRNGSSFLQSVEIYDPVTETWSTAGSMMSNYPAQAILLTDGRVLLLHPTDVNATAPGELFDPVRGTFQPMAPLQPASFSRRLGTLLASGKVLILDWKAPPTTYDPSTNSYDVHAGSCSIGNGGYQTWLRLLADGRVLCRDVYIPAVPGAVVLIYRGSIYDPQRDSTGRSSVAAPGPDVLLPSGRVLIARPLVTLFLGSHRLVAFVPPGLRGTLSAGVSVVNPAPGGGTTDPVPIGFVAPPRSGTISATPNPCTITSPEGMCTSTISWSTQNVSSAEVRLSVNGGTKQLFVAGSTSGSAPAPWISPGYDFTFELYDSASGVLLSSVTVMGTGTGPSGRIRAAPNPCTITSSNGMCTSIISWSTQDVSSAEVRLRVGGSPEQLFTAGTSGSVPAPWISNGHQFLFLLYDASTGQLLDDIDVLAIFCYAPSCQPGPGTP
jgi:Kelch motif